MVQPINLIFRFLQNVSAAPSMQEVFFLLLLRVSGVPLTKLCMIEHDCCQSCGRRKSWDHLERFRV